jgi:pimeloyl-ACP methyl ester carboxylesterase
MTESNASLTPAAASDLFRREPERFLDVGAGEAAHRRVGAGPDVLFVHGWPVTSATFRGLLPHLAEHVTCHLFDFPGTGSSRFTAETAMSIGQHIETVRRVVDALGLDDVAVVGHDSGGMIARHAMAGDGRLRAISLIDTEQLRLSWRFKSFLIARRLPGFGPAFGWIAGQPGVRRSELVLGGSFTDPSLLDGEFDEFFLRPLYTRPEHLAAAVRLLQSFDQKHIDALGDLHAKIGVPVQLVWGRDDPFFPLPWAEEMVGSFPDARLTVIENARLFSHEERPEEVAEALLPTLTGTR